MFLHPFLCFTIAMRTHPTIRHPALRHRMAQALNKLRHTYPYDPIWDVFTVHAYKVQRYGYVDACALMAQLEQELDTAQEAAIFQEIPY